MSTTTTPETNGTASGTETNGSRNRIRPALTGTKFTRLYALAAKCERKGFSLRRTLEEGSVSVRCDGFPTTLTPSAIAKLAGGGCKVNGRVTVGGATGAFSGVALGATATAIVDEMTAE